MADYVSGDMVRGHIDSIILNSLIDGDKDTNLIREEIEKRAAGKFQLKQGTFYSALQRIVKNGLVIEYRTTGSDGVRRKFFQLTEKGKAHIEKNQNNWTVSQEIINTLLDSEGPQVKFHRPSDYKPADNAPKTEEKLPDFTATDESEAQKVPKFGENIFESESEPELTFESSLPVLNEPQETTDECEDLPDFSENKAEEQHAEEAPTTFDDILNMLAKAEEERENSEHSAEKSDEKSSEPDENESLALQELDDIVKGKETENGAEAVAENDADKIKTSEKGNVLHVDFTNVNEENGKNETAASDEQNEVVSDDKIEENAEKSQNEAVVSAITGNSSENTAEHDKILGRQEEAPQAQIRVTDVSPSVYEPDDYLDSDDLPTQKEYREILNKIFASGEQPKHEDEEPKTENSLKDSSESAVPLAEEDNGDYGDVIVDELDFSNHNAVHNQTNFSENKRKNDENSDDFDEIGRKTEKIKKQVSPVGAYDYSDILELSKREGFKVTTADKTNKNELGKILVNKLNFHTALIFFAIVFIETFIVYFALDGVVKFGIGSYLLFIAAVMVLPLVYGVIYFFAPKRAVGEISSFKSSFETALIITLNLFLLIIAFAIVTNLDFSSSYEINAKIFIPVLIALNVPLFVVIRYSILENQTYFS